MPMTVVGTKLTRAGKLREVCFRAQSGRSVCGTAMSASDPNLTSLTLEGVFLSRAGCFAVDCTPVGKVEALNFACWKGLAE